MSRSGKTQAVVFTGVNQVAVEEVPLAELRPSDVMVQVEYTHVSTGTERWSLIGRMHAPGEPAPPFPFVPGYQAAGVVTQTGPDVRGVAPGDRVFSAGGRLAEALPGLCWGGHMGHHVTDCQNVIKLPDAVSTREASGLLLAQVGFNGATQPRVSKGDVVAIIGDGLVGQYAGQVFRHRGARVILSGHHDERLRIASLCAADEVVNSRGEDFAQYVRERCPDGVQIAAESASKNELIRMAIDLLEYNGQLVLLGYYPEGECMIDIHWVRARETTVYCPNSSTRQRMEHTLRLIEQDQMKVDELITHELSFTDAPGAYQMILDKSEEFLGVVFRWENT